MILRELLMGVSFNEETGGTDKHWTVEEYRGSWILRKLADLGMWIWDYERDHRRYTRTVDPAPRELALKADRRWVRKEERKERNR